MKFEYSIFMVIVNLSFGDDFFELFYLYLVFLSVVWCYNVIK